MELAFLIGLILLNGVFSMAEFALVSSRRVRLQRLADEGRAGAATALAMRAAPGPFLSTIQVGITAVGVLSGAVGEQAFVVPLAARISRVPPLEPHADAIALVVVVALITYAAVVIGELVPKRLGLLRPEALALRVAPPLRALAALARPLVLLFSSSSELVLRVLRVPRPTEPPVTDEEIEVLMKQGAEAGVFHESEREIVSHVLRLDEQPIGAIMTPRKDLFYVDLDEGEEAIREQLAGAPHHRVIVCRGGLERVAGVVHVTDLLRPALAGRPLAVEELLRPPLLVPETVTATQVLEQFRGAKTQFALVVDEYGAVQGIVTVSDILTAIVGEVPVEGAPAPVDAVRREDGSWLIDGEIGIERFRDILGIEPLPGEQDGRFHTLAGFVLHRLGRVPAVGDRFEEAGHRFEVVDMDRGRIDKLLVVPARRPEEGP